MESDCALDSFAALATAATALCDTASLISQAPDTNSINSSNTYSSGNNSNNTNSNDYESGSDYYTSDSANSTSLSSTPENNINSNSKRFFHNVCERRRREDMRDAFAQLQQRVFPHRMGGGVRVSKMDILWGAIERVKRVRKEVALLEAEARRRGLSI
jgi:hypothetical protein